MSLTSLRQQLGIVPAAPARGSKIAEDWIFEPQVRAAALAPAACTCCPSLMSLRNHGLLFSQFRRVCFYGPRSPHSSAAVSPSSPQALRRSQSPALLRQQRVLRTSTKACTRPPASPSPLNWSWTAHRIRHISPSAMSSTKTQTRGHAGHGHHHHHAHDNAYLLSSNKKDAGVRITRIGLYVNLGMAVGKGFGGYVFNSQGKCIHA